MMIRSRRIGRGCRLLVSLSVAVLMGLTRSSLAEVLSADGRRVTFRMPINVDGKLQTLEVLEGVPAQECVEAFVAQHGVGSSNVDSVLQEVRRKMFEPGAALTGKVHPVDHKRVLSFPVDTGGSTGAAPVMASFTLDGKEEMQALEFCSTHDGGPRCVASVLRAIAEMEQRQKMQASSIQSLPPPPQDPSPHSSDTKEGDSEKPSSMMVEAVRPSDVESSLVSLRVLLNGHMHVLVGQPGDMVSDVTDAFLAKHGVPDTFKPEILGALVDRVLGLSLDYAPLCLDFDPLTKARLSPPPTYLAPETNATVPHNNNTPQAPQTDSTAQDAQSVSASKAAAAEALRRSKVYRIDMYVNQELRVLSMSGAEDPAAVAREWCFQQGTQDAQHIALVTQTLQTAMREQDLRDELSVFEPLLHSPMTPDPHTTEDLPLTQGRELFRFNASDNYPPVVGVCGLSPHQVAEQWCITHDIRAAEVELVALLVAKHYDAYLHPPPPPPTQTHTTTPQPHTESWSVPLGPSVGGSSIAVLASLILLMAAAAFIKNKRTDKDTARSALRNGPKAKSPTNGSNGSNGKKRVTYAFPPLPALQQRAPSPPSCATTATANEPMPSGRHSRSRTPSPVNLPKPPNTPPPVCESWSSWVSRTFQPTTPFQLGAAVSASGVVLCCSGGWVLEGHEACDVARLLKNKKNSLTLAQLHWQVLHRTCGGEAVLLGLKGSNHRVLLGKTRAGIVVCGYSAQDMGKDSALMEFEAIKEQLLRSTPV